MVDTAYAAEKYRLNPAEVKYYFCFAEFLSRNDDLRRVCVKMKRKRKFISFLYQIVLKKQMKFQSSGKIKIDGKAISRFAEMIGFDFTKVRPENFKFFQELYDQFEGRDDYSTLEVFEYLCKRYSDAKYGDNQSDLESVVLFRMSDDRDENEKEGKKKGRIAKLTMHLKFLYRHKNSLILFVNPNADLESEIFPKIRKIVGDKRNTPYSVDRKDLKNIRYDTLDRYLDVYDTRKTNKWSVAKKLLLERYPTVCGSFLRGFKRDLQRGKRIIKGSALGIFPGKQYRA
jgi:hypothetical protein